MSIGWGLVFVASIEKLNAELFDTQAIENENIFTTLIFFGLVFVAFGLYFWTRQIITACRGTIEVADSPVGATFSIVLPIA